MTGDRIGEGLERLLGTMLLIGAAISTILLALGLVLYLGSSGRTGQELLDSGLVVLMATPVARVVVSFVEYVREREWFFVLTTAAVLIVLAGTLYVAGR